MSLSKRTAVTGVKRDKKGKVIAFNIDRRNWGRGDRGGSLLEVKITKEGDKQINMCCLGVYGRACGIGVKRLKNKGMPSQIAGKLPKQMEWTTDLYDFDNDSKACKALAEINDMESSSDASKEKRIIARFAKQGIKVRFVGKG